MNKIIESVYFQYNFFPKRYDYIHIGYNDKDFLKEMPKTKYKCKRYVEQ